MYRLRSLQHIKRYRQIISVFSKYGLRDLTAYAQAFRLPKPIAAPKILAKTSANLRLALQELGPTFIKAGQLLSSRSDLLPDAIINELQKLLDQVEPVSFTTIRKVLEEEYEQKLDSIFEYVDERPIASASLAQVHKAKLKNGPSVALKIQRPGITETITTDIHILYSFAQALQDRLPYVKAYNLTDIVAEFEKDLKKELNFELEGLNLQVIANNLKDFAYLKLPTVVQQYTKKKILCLEFIEGYKITEQEKIRLAGLDLKKLAVRLMDIYSNQIYIDGFFQADPHIGNIFIKENGLIQLVDFGSIGKLDENLRRETANLVFHFTFKEGEQATETLLRMGKQKPHTSYTSLKNEISEAISDYATMPPRYLSIGRGILELTRIAAKHNIEVPANFSLIGKTFLLLDDIIRRLDKDFDYLSYFKNLSALLIYERVQSDYSPQKIARSLVEVSKLTSSLPSKINYFIDKVLKDEFHVVFQHEGLEKVSDSINRAGFSIGLSLTAAGLAFLAILSILIDFPAVGIILGILAFIMLIYLTYRMVKNVKWK